MKNTIESDAKESALESARFVPDADELAESLPKPQTDLTDFFRTVFANPLSQIIPHS